jgi:DNA-binding transcriptional LysR family regulator
VKEQNTVAPDRTIDLNAVSVFTRVVETGSFTLAAQQLGLPKSAVSRRVARLELELGARLLHRTTRRLHLTDAGESYYRDASRALSELNDAANALSAAESEPRGTVRFTAPADFAQGLLSRLIVRFLERYPLVRIETVLTARLVDLVTEGFDLALRGGPMRDSSLMVRRIMATELILVASPRYLKRRAAPRSPAELGAHDCVMIRPQAGKNRLELTHTSGKRETVDVTGPSAADDIGFSRELVLEGAGIGLVAALDSYEYIAQGRLLRVLPRWRGPVGHLQIVYASAHVPHRVALFRDYLYDELRAECDRLAGRG